VSRETYWEVDEISLDWRLSRIRLVSRQSAELAMHEQFRRDVRPSVVLRVLVETCRIGGTSVSQVRPGPSSAKVARGRV
jgi:hypothetical protein